jgi:membrane protease YdiL (CAAX protease family)
MSTTTQNQQPPNSSSSLRGVVARHSVAAFLVMAFVFGWGGMFPLLLSENGPVTVVPIELPWMPFAAILSIFGLALPAFLVTAATDGKDGVRDLLSRILRWRVGVHWYLIALFGLLLATLLGAIPFFGLAPLEELAQKWELLFTLYLWGGLWGILVPVVLVNLWEETGWTGFMQHTLQERHGPLLASLIVAPFFALIHFPALFVSGWLGDKDPSLGDFPSALVQMFITAIFAVFIRVLIMWLYNGSGRSVLIVALFHSAFNATSGSENITPILIPGTAASLIPIAAVAVIAVVLVVFTRGRIAYEPGHGAAPRAAEAGGAAAHPRVR